MRRRQIHLVNPLWDAAGGSEWRTVELYREWTSHSDVTLWTEHQPHPIFAAALPIKRIDAAAGLHPTGGTLVFIGVYQPPGDWIALPGPSAPSSTTTRFPRASSSPSAPPMLAPLSLAHSCGK